MTTLTAIASQRGASKPYAFAFDTESEAGVVIVHHVQLVTLAYPIAAFNAMEFDMLHPESDPRLPHLAAAFGGPKLAEATKALLELLGQADPTGNPTRHEEWPLKIVCAEDTAQELTRLLTEVQRLAGEIEPS